MTTGNNCSCSTNTCSTNMCGSRSNGFLIVLVLYILLAIIIGSAFFC